MEKDIGTHIIYSDGRIYKKSSGKFIGHTMHGGYPEVCINGKQIKLHRVIAEAFLERQPHHTVVNHKNCIKTDNRVENLEWCTIADNVRHAFKAGVMVRHKGSKNSQSKLTEDQVTKIKSMLRDGLSQTNIARQFNVTIQAIYLIKKGRNWGHII